MVLANAFKVDDRLPDYNVSPSPPTGISLTTALTPSFTRLCRCQQVMHYDVSNSCNASPELR